MRTIAVAVAILSACSMQEVASLLHAGNSATKENEAVTQPGPKKQQQWDAHMNVLKKFIPAAFDMDGHQQKQADIAKMNKIKAENKPVYKWNAVRKDGIEVRPEEIQKVENGELVLKHGVVIDDEIVKGEAKGLNELGAVVEKLAARADELAKEAAKAKKAADQGEKDRRSSPGSTNLHERAATTLRGTADQAKKAADQAEMDYKEARTKKTYATAKALAKMDVVVQKLGARVDKLFEIERTVCTPAVMHSYAESIFMHCEEIFRSTKRARQEFDEADEQMYAVEQANNAEDGHVDFERHYNSEEENEDNEDNEATDESKGPVWLQVNEAHEEKEEDNEANEDEDDEEDDNEEDEEAYGDEHDEDEDREQDEKEHEEDEEEDEEDDQNSEKDSEEEEKDLTKPEANTEELAKEAEKDGTTDETKFLA